MALDWCFFFAVDTFVQDLYNRFYLFSQLWASLWTSPCQWKDLKIGDSPETNYKHTLSGT